MSLEISSKLDSNSDFNPLSLQNGESLQVRSGEHIQIRNPEIVTQLIPQGNDLQVVCRDGSIYILKSFLDTDFSHEPTLELKDGSSIARHNFVHIVDGLDRTDSFNEQFSQSHALAPLHVIALTSVSQKWDFSQYAPESESYKEKSDVLLKDSGTDQSNQPSSEPKEESQATSATRPDGSSIEIDRKSPHPRETTDEEAEEERGGATAFTTSIDAGFIDIDINDLIPQFQAGATSSDFMIIALTDDEEPIEIKFDSSKGILRLPDTIFDEEAQRKIIISIRENGNETDTAITVIQTKDGGGETFHLILSHDRLAENIEGALIGKLDTEDAGRGHTYEYSILQDEAGIFEIDRNVLKLRDDVSIDYEAQPDRYPLTIVSIDENGNRIEQTVSIWPEDVNEPATLSSIGIASGEDTTVSFKPEDFEESFEDEDSDYLEIIRIDSLPDNGVLFLNGERVTNGQLIDIDQVEDLEFHPDVNHNGVTNFTWSGFDGQSWSSESSSVNITIDSVNDAPVVKVSIGDELTVTDTDFQLELPENAFYDADIGDTLTYSGQIPSWLTIDPVTGSLNGTPGMSEIGDHEITITATDESGESVSQSFQVTVDQANRAPTISQIDNQTADEDALFSLDASSGFADQDVDDILTYSATLENGDPLPDWVSISAESGQISGTPSNEDVGSINVKVTASDGSESVSNSFSIEVLNTNDGPVVETRILDSVTGEDSIFTLETSGNFSDQDLGDILSFSARLENGDPIPEWLSIDPATGKLSGTPENQDVGTTTISVTASDGEASATGSFSLTVENTNDGPVVIADIPDQATEEDALFTLDSSANFDDADLGDELFYSATLENGEPLPGWLIIDSETGELSGTPANEDVGDISVTVVASDGSASASDSFTISVENTNDGPIVSSAIEHQAVAEDAAFSLDISNNFTDEDLGDTLTFSATLENGDPLPNWITFDSESGQISGTPGNDDIGDIQITVTAFDGEAEISQGFTLSIENTNDAPVLTSNIPDASSEEDSPFSLDVSSHFNDIDSNDELVFEAMLENGDPLPDWLSFDENTGLLSGQPTNEEVGDLAISIIASDGEELVSDTFTLTVENTNDGPVVTTSIDDQTTIEENSFNLDVSANFADEDLGDTLSYSATLENGESLPSWLTIDHETGQIFGTPQYDDAGELSITVTANDGETSASDTFSLTVENTGDGATITTSIEGHTTDEDAGFSLDISGNFANDMVGNTLSYSATLENGDSLPSWLSLDSETGLITGTPQNDDVGDVSITVTASDEQESSSYTFSLSVENTNDGPIVKTSIDNQVTDEDAIFSLDISSNFDDEDLGDELCYSATLENGDPLPSWLSVDSETGEISGIPENDDVGNINITVTATDGEASVSDTFSISVENTNDGPIVTSNILDRSTDEDASFNLDLSSHFADQDLDDALSFSATLDNGDPLPDWFSIDSDTGDLSGIPHNKDVGNIGIIVTVSDGEATVSDSFILNVENTNDGPTVSVNIADTTTSEDATFSLNVSGNFADQDLGDTLSYSATLENGDPLPSWLSIDSTTGHLSGTAGNDDVGNISVSVTASDGEASASDTFTLSVENTNDGPTVSTNIADTTAGEDAAFSLNVSSNFEDQDLGDTLTFTATLENGDPLPDWLSIDVETGELSGTPRNAEVGNFQVTVNASDGEASVSDTFSLTVENTNDGPTVTTGISNQNTNEDEAFSLDVSSNFDDEDLGDSLSYSATLENGDPLPDWVSIDAETGTLSGSPDNDDVDNISIIVIASDGEASVSDTFSLTVENTNDGPVVSCNIDNQSVEEDSTFSLDVASNFADQDLGDSLSYSATLENGDPLPDWVSIDSETGRILGTPHNTDVGNISITVTASDGEASVSDTFSLAIENTNDGPTVLTSIGNQTTNEDDTFSLDASANFEDEDLGDTLSFSATLENGDPLPSWLSIDTNTGELSGLPDNDDVGNYYITVTASDGEASASDTFSVNVENTNDGPVASTFIGNQNINEDNAFNLDLSSNFTDADVGDTLSFSASLVNGAPLPNWMSFDAQTGNLSGTPRNGDVGDIQIEIIASDGQAETSQTFTLTIENTNDGPMLATNISNVNTLEDDIFSLDVSSNFLDQDLGDTLSYSATLENGDPLPDWMSFNTATGEFSGTPLNEDVGNISVTVSASDGESAISDTFNLTVFNTNDAPLVQWLNENQGVEEDALFSMEASTIFVDVDEGDSLIFSATLENGDPLPTWISIDPVSGELSGTPTNDDVGEISLTLTASDGEAFTSKTFSLYIENTNDGPVVSSSIADQLVDEDAAFSLDISTNFADDDLGEPLSFSATLENGDPLPNWMSIDSETGEISGTPRSGDVGEISLTVTASDGEASVSDTFSLTIENTNDGPVVSTSIADQSTGEDTAFVLDISGNFADGDLGDTLSYSATLENGDPLPNWMSIDAATGLISGTPDNSDVGNVSVVITASDGEASVSDTFAITVENTNDGPIVSTSITDTTTLEDNAFTLELSGNFSDEDFGDSLTYTATLENGDPLPAWINVDSETGQISGTPRNSDVGNVSITVTASDGEASVSDTFSLTVENTNDGLTVTSNIANQNTEEDDAFTLDVSGNFADGDLGDILTYSGTLENGDPLPSWISIDVATGQLSGTPSNTDVGNVSINITVTDGESSASDIFSLTVANTNDGPTVSTNIDDEVTSEDSLFNLDVSGNFADADLGDTLSFSATLQNGDPLPSWLSIDAETGELSGTPRNNEVGILSVTVTASDGEASVSDTFDLTVENTNDGPTVSASISNAATSEDSAFSLNVIGNFADEDLDDTLAFTATLQNGDPLPTWLSIDATTGVLSGTPQNGDVGTIAIAVTASDGEADVSDTFDLTVANTNDGPIVSTSIEDVSTGEDAVFALDVSRNFEDQDLGDTLTYSATLESGDPLPEWISLDPATGELSGTPVNGDVGNITITVSATDGEESASDTFSLTVENTNDGPIVTTSIEDQTTGEDTAFSLDASASFEDQDLGDTLSYSATLENGDPLPDWISIDPTTGELSGTPENGDVGNISITVTASDGTASAADTFSITVENTNDGPTASTSIADQSTHEDSAFFLDVSGNFNDEDLGDSLTFTALLTNESGTQIGDGSLPNWLTFDETTGQFSGTPENGDVGSFCVQVSASDGEASANDIVAITVENTNDGPVVTADIADQTISEEAAFNLDVSGNFADADLGDTLTYSATLENGDSLPGWITIDPDTGEISGIPNESDVGNISVTVTASDGKASASNNFTINIRNVNKGPITNVDSAALIESTLVQIDVLSNDTDADGDSLTITSASVPTGDGSVSIVNNKLVFDPGSDFADLAMDETESIEITYTISDGHGGESTSTVDVTITGDDSLIVDNNYSHTVLGTANANTILGGDGHDTILGGDGDDIIIGGTGNDDLYGEGGDDTFLVSEGDGHDDFFGGEGTDTVKSADGSDIRIDGHFSASNSIESIDANGHEGVRIQGDSSSQTLDFSATSLDGIDTIDGGGGHDTIKGSQAGDTVIGGTGNDDLYGEGGDDTFLVSEGDGHDDFFGGEGTDTVKSADGSDIRIDGHFSASNSIESIDANGHEGVRIQGDSSSQTLDFSATSLDGIDTIDGGGGHDTIKGSQAGDTVIGGTGNDDLYGEGGDDTFLVSEGDGHDDFFGGDGTDTVKSADGSDIRIDGHFSASNSIESIDANGHEGVRIQGDSSSQTLDFSATSLDGIDTIDGGGGHDTIKGSQAGDTVIGGTGNDDLYGEGGDDTFLVSEGDGHDDFFGGEGTDTVKSADGSDIRIDGHFSASNSIESIDANGHEGVRIQGDSSSQTLDFSATSLDGIDTIDGGGGHDTIKGSQAGDTVIGGTGNDDLYGEGGDDTFLVSEGDGHDDFFGGDGTDTVKSADGSDIRIDGHFSASNSIESIDANGHEGVRIQGDSSSQTLDFSATSLDGIDTIDGGGGHDTIKGSQAGDTVIGGTGNDDLYGEGGDDTFLVSEGDGHDDFFGGEGTDTVKSADGSDIRIDGHFSASNSIESIDANGHEGVRIQGDSSSQTLDFSATSLDGIDTIDGGGGHDTIKGSQAGDTVIGGTGNDDLYGEGGDDTFLVSEGDGHDDFFGGEGTDTVKSADGSDIRIDGHFSASNSIESIDANGHEGVRIQGDSSSQTLDFSATSLDGIDTIDGGGGHDTIKGSQAGDTVIGGTGNDDLYGEGGDDTFLVSEGDGHDDFFGGDGTDTVKASGDNVNIGIDGHFSPSNSIENISADGHANVTLSGDGSSQTLDFSGTTLDGIQSIDAGAGHDIVTGSSADDTVEGGTGTDTYVLSGNRSDYYVTDNENGSFRVEDLVNGRGGVDTVSNFENFQFADGTLNSTDVLDNPPIVSSEIANQNTDEDSLFSLDTSANFQEIDGDTLAYSATLENGDPLPSWLSIDSNTGELSGTPENGDVGGISVTVTVSDGNALASDTFSITVENTNDGPTANDDNLSSFSPESATLSTEINFNDGVPTANYGTITQESYGIVGNAADFSSAKLSVNGIDLASDAGAKTTVSMWIQGDPSGSWEMLVGSARHDLVLLNGNIGFNTSQGDLFGSDASELSDGNWHHVVATFTNGDVTQNSIYIDGVDQSLSQIQGTPSSEYANIDSDSGTLHFGSWGYDDGYRFTGSMDEIKVYDGTLSSQEVGELYDIENSHNHWENAGASATEDTELVISPSDLLSNDTDVDGDSLTITSVQDATHGTVEINVDGDIVFTPDANYNGEASFSYTVSDGNGGTNTASVTLDVDAVNDNVSVVTDTNASTDSIAENTANGTEVGITAAAEDVDGDTVSYSIVDEFGDTSTDGPFEINATTGIITVRDTSQIDYETTTAHNIVVKATSSDGSTSTETYTVAVTDTNDGPIVSAAISDQTVNEEAAFSLDVSSSFTDEDVGDTLTYSATLQNGDPLPTWLSIDTDTGVLSGTPANGEDGAISVTVTASDGTASVSDTFDVTVNDIVPNLIGQWKLDETSGTTASDSTSTNDGTYHHGIVLGSSGLLDSGTAATFDGSNDYIEISPSNDFQVNDGTFVMTFNTDHLSGQQTLFSRDSSGYDGGGHLDAYVEADGTLTVRFQSETASYYVSSTSGAVDAGTNHQIAFSFGSQGMKLSLDGVEVDTNAYTGGIGGNSEPITIGSSQSSSGDGVADHMHDFFDGTIDNLEIYGGQLSQPSINTLYSQVAPEAEPELVGQWKLDETSGTAAADSVGTNDGVYTHGVALGSNGLLDTGTAANFDGVNDYVEIAPSEDFKISDGTFVMAFNVDSLSGQQTLFSRDSSGYDGGGHLDAHVEADGTLTVRFQSESHSYYVSSAPGAVVAGTNHQIAFSFGSNGMKLALDSVVVDTNAYSGGIGGNDEPITIGASQQTSGDGVANPLRDYFNGTIDNLEIYNGQLSQASLNTLYSEVDDNYTPVVDTLISDQSVDEDAAFSLDVSGNFTDANVGDTLTFAATLQNGDPLPTWLSFNTTTGQFSGTPGVDDDGAINVTVTASDGEASTADTFEIEVLPPPALVGQWKLDESSGTAAGDSVGTNDGVYTHGVTLGSNGVLDTGAAATFDGVNDYVEIAPSNDFQLANGTFVVSFNADDLSSDRTLFSRDSSGYDGGGHLDAYVETDGTVVVRFQSPDHSYYIESAASAVSVGENHQMAFSFGSKGVQLFLDGTLVDTDTYTGDIQGNNEPITIGASQTTSGNDTANNLHDFFSGRIDNLEIYDGQLGQSDVTALYANVSDPDQTYLGTDAVDNITTGSGDDTIDASDGDDVVSSGAGDDTIDAGKGADTIDAGTGDDTIQIENTTFIQLDFGAGEDTLEVLNSHIDLDFSLLDASKLTNVETIDLNGTGANSIHLSADDVLDMTDGDKTLFIEGGSDDTVEISTDFSNQGTHTVDGVDYSHYYDVGTNSHLYINNDITDLTTF